MHQFCASGDIDRSIATVQKALAERASLLAAALRREIPGVTFHELADAGAPGSAPVRGITGLWVLLPIIGQFVWFIKVQGALNRYWESKGAPPA